MRIFCDIRFNLIEIELILNMKLASDVRAHVSENYWLLDSS